MATETAEGRSGICEATWTEWRTRAWRKHRGDNYPRPPHKVAKYFCTYL